jgi:hypothetical protein
MKTQFILMLICSGTLFFIGCHPAVDYTACLTECETKTDQAIEAYQSCMAQAKKEFDHSIESCSELPNNNLRVACRLGAARRYTQDSTACESNFYQARKQLIGCSARCLLTDKKDKE